MNLFMCEEVMRRSKSIRFHRASNIERRELCIIYDEKKKYRGNETSLQTIQFCFVPECKFPSVDIITLNVIDVQLLLTPGLRPSTDHCYPLRCML